MPLLAAIDLGSNAIRLVIAEVDPERHITVRDYVREPVRLGQDVFRGGVISGETIARSVGAFRTFREAIDRHGARWTRAIATSAVREALNRDIFLAAIAEATAIHVTPVTEEEEARLIHRAVANSVDLKNKIALLVDIGGGSTEITLANDEGILSTESYRMGSVRLLEMRTGGEDSDESQFNHLVEEYVETTRRRLRREIGSRKIDLCVGTGGSLEALGDLRRELLAREKDSLLPIVDLETILRKLQGLSYEERVRQLRLRPDRADVIVPAAIIIQKIMSQAGVDELLIPHVGLKDGLLLDMTDELYGEKTSLRRDQVLLSARELGRKYAFDEQHATTVARLALELFDKSRTVHGLGLEQRLLLEVAALLHDIGTFVGASEHHKHTHYLVMASPIVGLSRDQVALVASVARYHRKSMPKQSHDAYRGLSGKERDTVSKLAAIVRLADALDNEHASKVKTVEVQWKKPKFILRLHGEGDLLLEKWALMKKAGMFEEVFDAKVVVEA